MITTQYTISLSKQAHPQQALAVQGDTGRSFVFTLSDYTIPGGATATYYVAKPSGEAVYNSATISGNTITCDMTAQSLAECGQNHMQVRITVGDEVVTSFDVDLIVRPFRGIDAIESSSESNIFDQAVEAAAEQFQTDAEAIVAEVVESIPDDYTALSNEVDELNERIGSLSDLDTEDKSSIVNAINEAAQTGGGGIIVVSTVAGMTDTSQVYLYNGTESGYTSGHWYYYDTGTSAWTDGGEYTGWNTVETALAAYLQSNAQTLGTLSITIGSTTYTYDGSADVAITLPVYDGGVS